MMAIVICYLFREIVQIVHTIGKGNRRHYDFWNFIDFLRIFTISSSIYFFFTRDGLKDIDDDREENDGLRDIDDDREENDGEDSIRELILVTVLSLTLAVFKELKILFLNFAKFVNSIEQICKSL